MTKRSNLSAEEIASRESILMAIRAELYRQDDLWGTPVSQDQTPDRRLSILVEEVGEYARDVLEHNPGNAFKELIQVAAVAAANAERIIGQGPDWR